MSPSSAENPERSDIKHFFKSCPVSSNATAGEGPSNDIVELIPLSDNEDSGNTRMAPVKSVSKKSKTVSEQSGNKTLILFEDVDADLCEDRGFISTIQQLAETAKRPMILTSNSKIYIYLSTCIIHQILNPTLPYLIYYL